MPKASVDCRDRHIGRNSMTMTFVIGLVMGLITGFVFGLLIST